MLPRNPSSEKYDHLRFAPKKKSVRESVIVPVLQGKRLFADRDEESMYDSNVPNQTAYEPLIQYTNPLNMETN